MLLLRTQLPYLLTLNSRPYQIRELSPSAKVSSASFKRLSSALKHFAYKSPGLGRLPF